MIIECPFYRTYRHADFNTNGKSTLSCEGGTVKFGDYQSYVLFVHRYCGKDWKRCTIAQSLNEWYERKDNQ